MAPENLDEDGTESTRAVFPKEQQKRNQGAEMVHILLDTGPVEKWARVDLVGKS